MLAAIEATLPTAPLVYQTEASGRIQAVDAPGAWFADRLAGQAPALLCNGNEDEYVSLMAVGMAPALVSGGGPLVQVVVNVPEYPGFVERVPEVVRAFGPAAGAHWGVDTLGKAGFAIAKGAGRASSDSALPGPRALSALVPGRLGWVSYWSQETCRLLGFSPEDGRASMFARVSPVPGRGVVLQLTDDMLDLARPVHLAKLRAAYDAFPAIAKMWGFG